MTDAELLPLVASHLENHLGGPVDREYLAAQLVHVRDRNKPGVTAAEVAQAILDAHEGRHDILYRDDTFDGLYGRNTTPEQEAELLQDQIDDLEDEEEGDA